MLWMNFVISVSTHLISTVVSTSSTNSTAVLKSTKISNSLIKDRNLREIQQISDLIKLPKRLIILATTERYRMLVRLSRTLSTNQRKGDFFYRQSVTLEPNRKQKMSCSIEPALQAKAWAHSTKPGKEQIVKLTRIRSVLIYTDRPKHRCWAPFLSGKHLQSRLPRGAHRWRMSDTQSATIMKWRAGRVEFGMEGLQSK